MESQFLQNVYMVEKKEDHMIHVCVNDPIPHLH